MKVSSERQIPFQEKSIFPLGTGNAFGVDIEQLFSECHARDDALKPERSPL